MTKAIRKRDLTLRYLQTLKPDAKRAFLVWDERTRGLALSVLPTGCKSWKFIYNHRGRTRWFTIGDADARGLEDARKEARKLRVQVDDGKDPQAERKGMAGRKPVTFEGLATRYLDEHAKKNNRSWKQADYLIRTHVYPRWEGTEANTISRSDVKELIRRVQAPVVANQVLAAISAIFSWAIKEEIGGVKDNPCKLVKRNEVKSRERVLSDSELPQFWSAFDAVGLIAGTALKVILLTGQRPGEVAHMRYEHIKDGWWEMPGVADPASKWPGTKNGENHDVWLSPPVRELIDQLETDDDNAGFVFGVSRLDASMREICKTLGLKDKVTPHDLRRTFSTTVTGLGLGRDAMNRVTNHKEGGIASVYDRHGYRPENKTIMESAAAHIMHVATGKRADDKKVVSLRG